MSVVLLVRHGQANFGLGTYDRLAEHGQAQVRRLAEVLGTRGVKVDRIISGDLDRQRETAEILASVLGGGLPVGIDPGWNEYDHMPLIARVKPMYKKHWLMVADLARTGNPNRRLQEIIDTALMRWVAEDEPSVRQPLPVLDSEGVADPAIAEAQAIVDPRNGEVLLRPEGGVHEMDLPEDTASLDVESFSAYRRRIDASLEAASAQSGTSIVVSSAGTITAAIAPLIGIPSSAWPSLHRVMVNSSVTKVVRGQRGISLISFNEHGHLEGVPGLQITYR